MQAFNPRVFADALFEEISDDLQEEESTYHDAIAAHQADYERIQRSGKIMEAQELNKIANFQENNTQEKKTLPGRLRRYETELFAGETTDMIRFTRGFIGELRKHLFRQ